MILGRHWKCWIFGHRLRNYKRQGLWAWLNGEKPKHNIKVCRRGCGIVEG